MEFAEDGNRVIDESWPDKCQGAVRFHCHQGNDIAIYGGDVN